MTSEDLTNVSAHYIHDIPIHPLQYGLDLASSSVIQ